MTDRGGWGGKSPHLPVLWDIWDRVGLGWDDGNGDSAMYGWWLGASVEGGANGADPSKHDKQRTRDERVVLPTHKGQVTKRNLVDALEILFSKSIKLYFNFPSNSLP